MKKFLCRKIHLRINILALILVLLFILATVLFFQYQMAENLYYRMMDASWVESAYICTGYQTFAELDRAEIAQLVDILNDVKIKDGVHRFYPTTYNSTCFQITFRNGKTLDIDVMFSKLRLNEYEYPDYKTGQKLLDLYNVLRQTHLEQEALS